MGRRARKPPPVPAGLPPWLATFSDMVTLLLTFFVMMMAMANFEDVDRVDAVIESLREALGTGGFSMEHLTSLDRDDLAEAVRREDTVEPLVTRLREAMAKHVSDDVVLVTQKNDEVRMIADGQVFFRPGSATLHPAAYPLLASLASIVAEEEVDLVVEGHSDATGDESENWRLSALRAVAVVEALRSRGEVPGVRLTAAGLGSFRPANTNNPDDPWNRRIEFVFRTDSLGAKRALERISKGE